MPTQTAAPTPAQTATPAPTVLDLSGNWTITVVNTITTGACSGESGSGFVHDATIDQTGSTFTISGFGTTSSDLWQGNLNGTTVTFSGDRSEDGGTTTATFTLEVDPAAFTVTGREDWNWTGPDGSCPGSASDVTGTKVG